jgi:hypothetical protein
MSKLMSNFFAFGCSFTNYRWPTWADIVGQSFSNFQNWGRSGAGNQYIYNSLIECHLKKNIKKNDFVAIMWSSTGREDRYVNYRWLTPGNIYNSNQYDQEFIKKFVDQRGFIIRDLALMFGAKKILDSIGCEYRFFSMVPVTVKDDYLTDDRSNIVDDILPCYQELTNTLKPSIFQTVFNFDWDSRPFVVPGAKSFWQRWYNEIKDQSWPELDNKQDYQLLSPKIKKECEEIFGFFIPSINNQSSRFDYHPTPGEHLEYIELILPELAINNDVKNWVNDCDNQIKNNTWNDAKWESCKKLPIRW